MLRFSPKYRSCDSYGERERERETLQQNVFLVTNFSEEIFFITKNLHLAKKFIIRH